MFTAIGGVLSGLFGGNKEPQNITVQAQKQDNTPIIIIGAISLVVVVVFAILLTKKNN